MNQLEPTSDLRAPQSQPGPDEATGERAGGPAASLVLPTLAGFAAMVAITVGAIFAGSPYDLNLAGAWGFGVGQHSVHAKELGIASVLVGVAVLVIAWVRLVRYLRAETATPVRTVGIIFALWVLPAILAPPMFSRDIYSYAADGQMVASGINPYRNGPEALGYIDPRFVSLVDPIWQDTPTPYGPLSIGLDAGVVDATRHHEAAAIEGMRLLALGGVVLAAALLPGLARKWGTAPALAVALAALNPLTLLGLVSPGHNDALMVGLMISGLALAARGRPVLAVAACALAAAVKSPALIATAYIAWDWAGRGATWRRWTRVLGVTTLVTLGVLEVMSLVTGLGWGWIHTMGVAGTVHSVITPTTDLALFAERAVHVLRFGPSTSTFIVVTRGLGYVLAAAAIGWLLWRRSRVGALLALALSLFVLVALGPVYQPWYLAWGLFCLAPVAVDRWWTLLMAVSIFGTVTVLPRFEPLVSSTGVAGDAFGLVAFTLLAALCSAKWESRIRRAGWVQLRRRV